MSAESLGRPIPSTRRAYGAALLPLSGSSNVVASSARNLKIVSHWWPPVSPLGTAVFELAPAVDPSTPLRGVGQRRTATAATGIGTSATAIAIARAGTGIGGLGVTSSTNPPSTSDVTGSVTSFARASGGGRPGGLPHKRGSQGRMDTDKDRKPGESGYPECSHSLPSYRGCEHQDTGCPAGAQEY
jgi:hypothetical protein